MKKIMFDDKYGLTAAVLEGRKTMTRRGISKQVCVKASTYRIDYFADTLDALSEEEALLNFSPYKFGEVVAVAQSYHALNKAGFVAPEWCEHTCEDSPGYSNKMFVRADLMPYQIRITNVRVERLKDISDEDCIREGILEDCPGVQYSFPTEIGYCGQYPFSTPREAFAALIDKISGKGTWESNPWVFVYEFELVK